MTPPLFDFFVDILVDHFGKPCFQRRPQLHIERVKKPLEKSTPFEISLVYGINMIFYLYFFFYLILCTFFKLFLKKFEAVAVNGIISVIEA